MPSKRERSPGEKPGDAILLAKGGCGAGEKERVGGVGVELATAQRGLSHLRYRFKSVQLPLREKVCRSVQVCAPFVIQPKRGCNHKFREFPRALGQ